MSNVVPTESAAAMSLWQKFAELQTTADVLRTERRAVENESERLAGEIQRMKIGIETETKQIESVKKEPAIESLRQALDVVQEAHSTALTTRNDAKVALEQWTAWKQEETERSLAYDRAFRIQCEQWNLRAIAAGLTHASSQAAVFSFNPADAVPFALDEALVTLEPLDHAGRDPLLWKILEDDEELQIAVDRYRAAATLRQEVQNHADESNAMLRAIVAKQIAADQRSVDLQSRLEAILGETQTVQSSLNEVEELILHEEALGDSYRSKISGRHQRRQPASYNLPPRSFLGRTQESAAATSTHQSPDRAGGIGIGVLNPYAPHQPARRRVTMSAPRGPPISSAYPVTTNTASTASRPETTVHDDVMDAVLGTRRRRDRQFGCSVSVGLPSEGPKKSALFVADEDSDDDDDEDLFFSPGFTKKHKTTADALSNDRAD